MKKLLFILIALNLFSGVLMAQTIKHHAYTIYFNQSIHAPDSVSWDLNPSMLCPLVTRVDKFAKDPLLENSPKPSDFVQISTDKANEGAKGHLFSYEDAMCNPIDKVECFYVSQMYWQYQSFNAGDWKTVEVYERTLAKTSNIHIIAGYIGAAGKLPSGEIIPQFMYKAILFNGKYTCWIMPNLPTTKGHKFPFWEVTTTKLDSQTGLKL